MNEEKMAFGMFLVQTIAESCGLEFKGQISELERKIDRAVYKGTDCGAWVRFDEKGIVVGSIAVLPVRRWGCMVICLTASFC